MLAMGPLSQCGTEDPVKLSVDTKPKPVEAGPDVGRDRSVDLPVVPDGPTCAGKPDGTDCSTTTQTNLVCLKGVCQTSSCGDLYVDTKNSEDCDDGNTDPTDGCDMCKFLCKAATDCDDQEACNGSETCDVSHKCLAGTNLADGTACTATGVTAGTCKAGKCVAAKCGNAVKDTGEECDDGNTKDNDGCNNDCKFSCHADADCDDSDVCTGKETCKIEATKQTCLKGTALNCDDSKACTTDACDKVKGCTNTPIDADGDGVAMAPCGTDCDDTDSTVFGDPDGTGPLKAAPECLDGRDNDCNGTKDDNPVTATCWPDPDKDTYAAAGSTGIPGCVCPASYTSKNPATPGLADCAATLAAVHPGQLTWYNVGYCVSWAGNPAVCNKWSYDYNCSGAATSRWGVLHTACVWHDIDATHTAPYCTGAGWSAAQNFAGCPTPTVPCCLDTAANSVQGKWTACNVSGTTCLEAESLVRQQCR
jgi:cysteine-rich repeat protein